MNLLTLEKSRLFDFLENIKSENLGFSFSFLLHSLLLLFVIGLPNFFDSKPIIIPTIIPIEIINITESTTNISKKSNDTNLIEEKQKNVEEKKFNSSDIKEIQKIDIKEKPQSDIKEIQKIDIKEKPQSDIQEIQKVDIKEKPKIEIKKTPKQEIVIEENTEVQINQKKEKIKIDINQVESLPTKKIKPKLKPKPNLVIEKPEKKLDVVVKAKLKPKPNLVIEKPEKQQDVIVKQKPKPMQDPELSMASLVKDLRNEETITSVEKKIENKEEVKEDIKSKINKDLENEAKISIGNKMVQQIQQCWSINSGERKEEELKEAQYIVAEAQYNKNGSIVSNSVQIIDTNISEDSILISGVKYALYNCRLKLPKEYYYLWEKNKIRFDHDFLRQKNMNLFN